MNRRTLMKPLPSLPSYVSYGRNYPKCKSEAQLRCHRQFSQRNQVSHTSCTGCAAHPETTQGWYGASEHNRNGQWAWNTRKSLHSWAKGVAANRLGIAAFILHICCPGGNITVIYSLLGSLNTAIRVPKDHSMSWNVKMTNQMSRHQISLTMTNLTVQPPGGSRPSLWKRSGFTE